MTWLKRCTAGRILILGEDIHALSGEARRCLLHCFGVMFQQWALFGSMSVLENVMLPLATLTRLPQDAIERIARIKLGQSGLG